MLTVAGIVFLGAVAMLLIGWFRREEPGLPFFGESERANTGLVIVFGIAIPIVILVALFVVSDLYLRCAQAYGVQRAQRMIGLKFRDQRIPTLDEFAEAVDRMHLGAVRLTPA